MTTQGCRGSCLLFLLLLVAACGIDKPRGLTPAPGTGGVPGLGGGPDAGGSAGSSNGSPGGAGGGAGRILSFLTPTPHPAGVDPDSVAAGDLNGDGMADIAVAGWFGGVNVYLSMKSGGLSEPNNYLADGADALQAKVVIGDLNGDGKPDLAVSDTKNGISILLNDGRGALTAAGTYAVPNLSTFSPHSSMALGDLNDDGRIDLAVPNSEGYVSVLFNKGNGEFRDPVNFLARVAKDPEFRQGIPCAVALGDLNRDGKLDMVVANTGADDGDPDVSVLLNLGQATFGAPTPTDVGGDPYAIGLVDSRGDGTVDVVVSVMRGASVLLRNRGDGSFGDQVVLDSRGGAVASADFNLDGHADLVLGMSLLLNKGDGSFGRPATYAVGAGGWVAVGDLNGDGKVDLAVTDGGINLRRPGFVSALLNDGRGGFPAPVYYPVPDPSYGLVEGDFNGDGRLDLLLGRAVLLNDGTGSFPAPTPSSLIETSADPFLVEAADLDGDRDLDLAIITVERSAFVMLNRGDGTFAPATPGVFDLTLGATEFILSIRAADLNGDGRPDLAVLNYDQETGTRYIDVFPNNGGRTFAAVIKHPVALSATAFEVEDVSGDGKPDLLVLNQGVRPRPDLGTVSVLLNKGNGAFSEAVDYVGGVDQSTLLIGDLTGDGKPDLVVASPGYQGMPGTDDVRVLLNAGDGTFGFPVAYSMPSIPRSAALGDLDGDGQIDLAVANGPGPGYGEVSVLLNQGHGRFGAPTSVRAYGNLKIADVSGDGRPDLVLWTSGVAVMLNTSH